MWLKTQKLHIKGGLQAILLGAKALGVMPKKQLLVQQPLLVPFLLLPQQVHPLQEMQLLHQPRLSLLQQQLRSLQAVIRSLLQLVQYPLLQIIRLKLPLMRLQFQQMTLVLLLKQGLRSLVIRLKHLQQAFWSGVLWTQAKHLIGLLFLVHKHRAGVSLVRAKHRAGLLFLVHKHLVGHLYQHHKLLIGKR